MPLVVAALTVTASVALALLVLPAALCSVAVAVTEKVIALAAAIVRCDRFQPATFTEVLPVAAVKLWVPSARVTPAGSPASISDCRLLLSPLRPLTVSLKVPRAIGEPAVPLAEPLDHATLGASGSTVTASLTLALLVLPAASCSVAVAVNVKLVSLGGVI